MPVTEAGKTSPTTMRIPERAPEVCPLTREAYHALGEMGFLPEKTELLYGPRLE
jgi:hypothetical protein